MRQSNFRLIVFQCKIYSNMLALGIHYAFINIMTADNIRKL